MTWTESIALMGNVGEFVGSIGVLVSLIYLATQIKKSTEAEQTSTFQAIVRDFGDMNQMMAGGPDLSYLYVQALENFEILKPDEKARISQVFFMTFRYFENMFYQHRKGYLEEEVWAGWKRLILTYFARDGFQTWWSVRRDVFSEPFAHFLETETLDRPIASYADVTGITASAV
jgi:hypothetical protein